MITRRNVLKAIAALGIGGVSFTTYAFAESFRGTDAILLLGDYVVGHRMGKYSTPVTAGSWATELARLKAPLGVHAVLGNHDWWDQIETQHRRKGPTRAGLALEAAGVPVYENRAVRLSKDGQPFWIAGLGDQWAFWPLEKDYEKFKREGKIGYEGVDDLPATLAQIKDDAPVILMAHEPDIFPDVPDRVAVTLSGHTHGGQVRLLGWSPVAVSGRKLAYGHIRMNCDVVVSGGLGCSIMPFRIGVPPEIVLVTLGGAGAVVS